MNNLTTPNRLLSPAALIQNVFQIKSLGRRILLPLFGLLMFLFIWHSVAQMINTSLGKFPGPAEVWQQGEALTKEAQAEHKRAIDFYARQKARNARILAADPKAHVEIIPYTGTPTFFDQIGTSLMTVMAGFLLASLIAIPVGIAIGLNEFVYAAFNPLIQLFKPVSPLAWLPLVTMVVSAVYVSNDPAFSKSFLVSMFTVLLCCLWPTIINTAVGVANVSKDLVNVSRVLQLPPLTHVFKIVLPASLPMMFTGLRLSLGIAWMVLIAAEMLAQNPGLGKFVWDQFQNGSSNSLGRIMVAVLVIGFIGFLLDRAMLVLQRAVSWDKNAILR